MATVLISGGTGLVGRALTAELVRRNYEVIILTRRSSKQEGRIRYSHWDPAKKQIETDAIQRADFIVHLAGANVGQGRWTAKRKKEIIDSRVQSGELLVHALKHNPNHVKAVVSASAMGIYGPDNEKPVPFLETDKPSEAFLGRVVQQWERAIEPVKTLNKRLVILRGGIVLSNEGGAYKEFKKRLRFGVASVLGPGNQVVSWIHIDDFVRMFIEAMENDQWHGIFNAVTPHPVTNRELIMTMAGKRKFFIPVRVPAFVLKTMLGEMSVELLKSTTVSAAKIENIGFSFLYPTIAGAIQQLEAS